MAKFKIKDGVAIIPEKTTEIGREAFKNSRTLVEATIPSAVTTIEASAFEGCKKHVIVMEYQGRRAAITCHDHYLVTCIRFYPNYPWTTPLPPSKREGHYIDFQVLALNAVTAYLKLMPTLQWEAE